MANATSVYQYEQPRMPDGWNESERRFYNRLIQVLDDIYAKYGRIDEKMLTKTVVNKIENGTVMTLQKMISSIVSAEKIVADSIEATFAYMVSLSAKYGSYDFNTIQNLVADAMVLEQGQANSVHITNLVATYAQAVQATVGNLCIKASDGNYYQLDVNSEGLVVPRKVEVNDAETDRGETDDAKVIIETSISAEKMTTQTLFGTQALLNEITAATINVDQLFARKAFVEKLITTDISSNSYIQQSIVDVTTSEVEKFARLDGEGLHVGEKDGASEVVITSQTVDVRVNGDAYGRFGSNFMRFGDYQMRRTSDGGIAFSVVDVKG